MTWVQDDPALAWAIGLAVGFPLLAIVLGRLITAARLQANPARPVLLGLRNVFLPLLALWLVLDRVAGLDPASVPARLALTLVLLAGVSLALSFTVAVVFGAAPRGSARANTPKLLRDLVGALVIILGGVVILSAVWGQDVAAPFAALGIGSVVIGLALQETLGNVMSGIALLMERPFAEGDWIEADGNEGVVEEINWRAVRLRNRDGDRVVIPHGVIAGGVILNNTQPDPIDRVGFDVGFSYDDPPNEARRVLLETARGTPGILAEPAPSVQTMGYGDSSVDYRVYFFIANAADRPRIRSDYATRVWYAAQRAGLTIPFPIRTLVRGDSRADTAKEAVGEGLLRGALKPADLDAWASGARLVRYADGEAALAQGEKGEALHLIVTGRARLTGGGRELYVLGRGEFFGEVAAFTGGPSPYAATASGDLATLALPRAALDRLIEERPGLAVEVGQIMDARRRAAAA